MSDSRGKWMLWSGQPVRQNRDRKVLLSPSVPFMAAYAQAMSTMSYSFSPCKSSSLSLYLTVELSRTGWMIIHAAPFVDLSTRPAVSLIVSTYPLYTCLPSFSIPLSLFLRDRLCFDDRFEMNSYSLDIFFFLVIRENVKSVNMKSCSKGFFSQKKKINRRKKLKILLWEFGLERGIGETVPLKALFDSSRFISIDCRNFLKCPLKAVQMLWMGSPTHWPTFFPTRTTYFQESLVSSFR